MTFFIDANITIRAATVLENVFFKHRFKSIEDEFGAGVKDVEWLRQIAKRKDRPTVLSCDAKILADPIERKALEEAGVSYVLLTKGWANMPWTEQAWRLIKIWPRVVAAVSLKDEPCVFRILSATLLVQEVKERRR